MAEMRRHKLYHLLVTRGENVVGVFSVVDAMRSLVSKLEAAGDVERIDAVKSFFNERVENVSTRPVIVVDEGVSLKDAARIMHNHGIGCLPTVRGEEVVGAICEPDIVEALAEARIEDPVYMFSTRRVVYAEPTALVMEALGVMAEGGFRRLPVIEDGRVKGITTVHLLMEGLLEDPKLLYREVTRAMTDARLVEPETPVSLAAREILASSIGAVLVARERIAGIFTERDAVRVYGLGV